METLEILCEAQEKRDDESVGLSSQEALKRLFDAIKDELSTYMEANSCTWREDLWNTLSHNHHLPISFISLGFLILEVLVMVLSYALAGSTRKY
ncbi:unnamed protein product, partial [Porites evermanni]